MSKPRRCAGVITASLLALSTYAAAQPVTESAARAPVATEQVGGTLLTVQPLVPFERVQLRVSGPGDYSLRRSFGKEGSISIDLLADASPVASGPKREQGERELRPLERLADGIYRYEAVIYNGDRTRRAHTGRFFVEGGSAISRSVKRQELAELRRNLQESEPSRRAGSEGANAQSRFLDENDYIYIDDYVGDGETALTLDSDGAGVPLGFYWGIANDYDSLQLGRSDLRASIDDPQLSIDAAGRVGIGTTTPDAKVHAVRSNGFRVLRLTGGIGDTYDISLGIGGDGLFIYNDEGTEIVELWHNAAPSTLVVDENGLNVQGDLTASSSRELKTAFSALDSAEILQQIIELPIQSWQFKSDTQGTRHVGPIAEDFHEAFGLGIDDKHISPSDTAGLALVAIQELAAKLEIKLETIEELAERVDTLATENAQLKEEVARLRDAPSPRARTEP